MLRDFGEAPLQADRIVEPSQLAERGALLGAAVIRTHGVAAAAAADREVVAPLLGGVEGRERRRAREVPRRWSGGARGEGQARRAQDGSSQAHFHPLQARKAAQWDISTKQGGR